MDADRFDSIARTLSASSSRRAALGTTALGGLLGALGLGGAAPEVRAAQGGTCVMQFAAQVRQGPSAGRAVVPNGARAGELRGELSFALEQSGRLQNGLLQLPGGETLPVVGQAMGHSLQLRIELGERVALVAVGVGEQQISRCQGAIDGMATGPDIGDLGDWHGAAVQQARGGGQAGSGSGSGVATQDSSAESGEDAATARSDRAGRGRGGNASGSTGLSGDSDASGGGASNVPSGGSSATNGEACPQGQTSCANLECIDLGIDPINCGECTDLRTDVFNCGACGNRCPGPVCQDGRCLSEEEADQAGATDLECDEGETFCDLQEGYCADLRTDPLNCGQCGLPCASELGAGTCIDGECACSPGTTRCDDVCVNTERDPLNCGECGNECPDDGECFEGACAAGGGSTSGSSTGGGNAGGGSGQACPENETRCGDTCVDLQTDPDNCGTCGTACPAGESCVGGECAPGATGETGTDVATGAAAEGIGQELDVGPLLNADCPEGQIQCGNACSNGLTLADGGVVCAGGGAPPSACPPGQALCNGACFAEGACQPADCPPGQGRCYGFCKDFATDPGYCGNCNTSCPGAICSGGTCVNCAAGQTPCGAACVDTATDLANCGFCGNPCGTQCINGECTGIGPSPIDCGDVGESCVGRPCCGGNVCANGTCYVATESNGACGAFVGDPIRCAIPGPIFFCVDVDNDPNFCGDCGTVCAAGDLCRDGNCVAATALSDVQTLAPTDVEPDPADTEPESTEPEPADPQALAPTDVGPCPEGQVDCGGVCTNVSVDPLNCGECGFVCGSGSTCDLGVCGADPAAQTAPEEPVVAAEEPAAAAAEPAECLAAGGACDPATPGACCSGACNDEGTCA